MISFKSLFCVVLIDTIIQNFFI